jgi:probable HAF family extracellular repeat protein
MRFLLPSAARLQKATLLLALSLLVAPFLLGADIAQTPQKNTPERYDIIDLGPLPSVAADVSLGINSSGQVSLWTQSSSGTVHAATWNDRHTTDLGTCRGYESSISHAIDARGRTVGWVVSGRNLVDSLATMRGFVCDGKMRILGTLGGKNSRAMAENEHGEIVGEAQTASGERHAFLFRRGRMTDLGTLPTGKISIADCINSAGDAAGAADTGMGSRHAVLWVKGKIQDLGTLPEGRVSYATAINDKGDVAGFAQTPDGYHAFLWSGGKMEDLGTLVDDPSNAKGLNNLDQVVGSCSVGNFKLHAFFWQNGQMVDLNKLIPKGSGWEITDAFAINDSGQIACCGHGRDDMLHALLLTPGTAKPAQ